MHVCAHSRQAAGWIPGSSLCVSGLDVVDPAGLGGVRQSRRDASQWPIAADSRPEAAASGTCALGAHEEEQGERDERPTELEEERKLPSSTRGKGPAKLTRGKRVREARDGSGGDSPFRTVRSASFHRMERVSTYSPTRLDR